MVLAVALVGLVQMIGAALVLAWSAAASTLALLTSTLSAVFSLNGLKILTSCVLIWLVAAVWSASHANVYEIVDDVWCESGPLRIWLTNIVDFFAQQSEGLICFYNLIIHWTSIFTFEFIAIAIECPDPVIYAAGELFSMVGSILNQALQVLFHPLSYNVDFTQVWVHWTSALEEIVNYSECFCYDLSPIIDFAKKIVSVPSLQCTLESAINSVLAIVRIPVKIFFSNFPSLALEWPDFTDAFNQLCSLVGCLGDIFDEWLVVLIETRSGTTANNPAIGCTIGRFICVLLRVVELLINFFILIFQLVTTVVDLAQFIDNGLDFNPLLDSIGELADCVYLLFSNFNTCAGEALRQALLLVSRTIELLLAIIRNPTGFDTAVANWKATLDNVIGHTQYGDLDEYISPYFVHSNGPIGVVSGLHSMEWYCDMNNDGIINAYSITTGFGLFSGSDTSFPCNPGYTDVTTCEIPGSGGYRGHCILQGSRKQTALTCFVASILGNGICSRAIADLLSSIVQLLLTALDFALQLYQGAAAPNNTGVCGPFGTSPDRTATLVFIKSLFDLVVSRVLSIFDYLGHVLECLPLFSPFGHIISVVIYGIYDVINDLTRLLAIITAFVIEGIIMIIELFSGFNLFPGCNQKQIVFWIRIFFENLLTEIFRIIAAFINIVLFDGFPGVINFGAPNFSDEGHPGFTECIVHFGDCICVLVESIIQSIFMSVGPFCGPVVWSALRKRDVGETYDMNHEAQQAYDDYRKHPVFEFVDRMTNNKFSRETECGFIMHEYNPYRNHNLTEYQQSKYYECMKRFVAGFQLAQKVPGVPLDFFFDKAKVHNTTMNLIRSVPYMFYYWVTQSNQTTEEFMPHIDDPVTHLVWKSTMDGKREMAERLRANSPAAPSNRVYEHYEMGSEAIRLALSIPFKLFDSLSKRNFTEAAGKAVEHASEIVKRDVYSTFAPPYSVYDPDLVYKKANATESLRMAQMAIGIQAYADIFRYGGDYVLQAHSPILTNISDILNLIINGRLNASYRDVPPLIPGFQCRGFDGILRRLYNRTMACIVQFNITGALNITTLGTWGSLSLDPTITDSIQPLISPQVFVVSAVTPSGKSDWLTTVIYDVAQFLNERLIGSLLGDVRQWPAKLLAIFSNTAVDSSPSSSGHGIWWYLIFPFYCSQDKLNCSEGRGLVEGVKWTLLYVTILLLFIGFVLPPGLSTLAVMGLTMGVPVIFLGVTFGYAPVCFPRIPECSLTEVANLLKSVNVTCIPWPAGVATGACTTACVDRTIVDCRSTIGIVDGFDELVLLFEWSFPTEMQMFRDSFVYGYVERIVWLRQTLEQNILNGAVPSSVQQFCFFTQILLFVQVITLLTLSGGVAGVAVLAVVSLLTATTTFISSLFTVLSSFIIAWKMGRLDDAIEEARMQSTAYRSPEARPLVVEGQVPVEPRSGIVRRKQQ